MDYLKAIGEPFIFPELLEEKNLGIFQIPLKNFDAVASSDANSFFDGLEDNYIGTPSNLLWFGRLSLGRFNKLKKETTGYYIDSSIPAEKLLEDSLIANDKYRDKKFIDCAYFLFAEGVTGGRLVVRLKQGARRFASAYAKAFDEGKLNLTVPCNLTIIKLNKEKTVQLIEQYKNSLNKENILKVFAKWISKILLKEDDTAIISEQDKLCYKKQELALLRQFLKHQEILEPVFNNIINILLDKATSEDLEKVFRAVNSYYTSEIRKAFV